MKRNVKLIKTQMYVINVCNVSNVRVKMIKISKKYQQNLLNISYFNFPIQNCFMCCYYAKPDTKSSK